MIRRLALALALLGAAAPAMAQINFPTPNGNVNAEGHQVMCLNGSSQSVPCSATVPLQVTGAGGGPATIANGADVAQGSTTDAACATDNGMCTEIALLKRNNQQLTSLIAALPATPSTGTQSNVASSATDVTILAANASRAGATVFNDSSQVLYLLLASATSSATVFTIKLDPSASYDVPFRYTGVIKGIWAAANGAARVTELQ